MHRLLKCVVPIVLATTLFGCVQHPRESMFPPTVSVQQLKVLPDGHWQMQVRILNNSYGGMAFQRLKLTMTINNQPAAQIDTRIHLTIPALSPDTTSVTVTPTPQAATALLAIADKGSAATLGYTLKGTAWAIPNHTEKPRDYPVDSHNWLSAIPGVAHTFR